MTWRQIITLALAAGIATSLLACTHAATPSFTTPDVPAHADCTPDGGPLTACFFGTSTISLSDGQTTIMTDAFLTRPSLWPLITGAVAPKPDIISAALNRAGIAELDAIFVAHAHYDHALDSATVADLHDDTRLIGSSSLVALAQAERFGRAERFVDRQAIRVGDDFTVTPIRSPHSPPLRYPGSITRMPDEGPPWRARDYLEGGNYSFLVTHGEQTILIIPSANLSPGLHACDRVDVVFLGVGTLGNQGDDFITQLWDETVGATGASLVIPIHWDNFTLPLTRPLRPMPPIDNLGHTERVLNERAEDDGVEIRWLGAFDPVDLSRSTRRERIPCDPTAAPS